ncbi:MAG: ABC transporter permease [Candidatus Wallbacteria bacterium]|nr:ABC transporter permease [Candidatus Wallbacteria bacterium]
MLELYVDTTIAILLQSAIIGATPLILAALGGLFSERAGIVNIGLEGLMLSGAFAAALTTLKTGSPWLGILAGAAAGAAVALIHAVVCIRFKADQVVSGVALNMFASGLTLFLAQVFCERQRSFAIPEEARLPVLADLLGPIPVLGAMSPLVFLAVLAAPLTWLVVYRTRFGLRLRAVGENPHAADTAGVPVALYRYAGVLISGALAGLGGAYLPFYAGSFVKNMSGGRGYIALAALIFGKWQPAGVFVACLLFGLASAVQDFVQGTWLPSQFAQMIPYVVTMVTLAGFIGQAGPPGALGKPYEKEAR